jgi:MFS family permease
MVLPSLLFGVLAVLVPLRFDDAGWGAVAIGAVFLVAACFEVVVAPVIGRLSDRVGRLAPLRAALVASIGVSLVLAWAESPALLAPLVLVAGLAYGAFWAPAMALLADGAERFGLAQGLAFGLMNLAWAAGNVLGPAAGGSIADAAGDALPFLLSACLCGTTALLLRLRLPTGTRMARVPESPP